MVCVDCSMSMSQDSEFYRNEGDASEDVSGMGFSDDDGDDHEVAPAPNKSLDDLKGKFSHYLRNHPGGMNQLSLLLITSSFFRNHFGSRIVQ